LKEIASSSCQKKNLRTAEGETAEPKIETPKEEPNQSKRQSCAIEPVKSCHAPPAEMRLPQSLATPSYRLSFSDAQKLSNCTNAATAFYKNYVRIHAALELERLKVFQMTTTSRS